MRDEIVSESIIDAATAAAAQAVKREKMLYGAIVAGVLWSLFYTAVSLVIMYTVALDSNTSCQQFSDSRDTVRALVLSHDDWGIDVETLNQILPRIECD